MEKHLPFYGFAADTLTGQTPKWQSEFDTADFLEFCQFHGIAGLLADSVRPSQHVPVQIIEDLNQKTNELRLLDKLQNKALAQMVTILQAHQIPTIVLKGSALANTIYSASHLRPRGDIDLLVQLKHAKKLDELMTRLGLSRSGDPGTAWDTRQVSYSMQDAFNCRHDFDIHYKISNQLVFSKHFSWIELFLNSEEIKSPDTGNLRVLSPIYQLIHACLHRSTHLHMPYQVEDQSRPGDRIVWLYDMYLIGGSLSESDWNQAEKLSKDKQMSAICRDALTATGELFHSDPIITTAARFDSNSRELSAMLLHRKRWSFSLAELMAMSGFRNRCRLVFRLLFPPTSVMQQQYGYSHAYELVWLYPKRLISRLLRQLSG